jgi:hypothetical protein
MWSWPIQTPYIQSTKTYVPFPLFRLYLNISPGSRHMYPSQNKASFYGNELLASCPTLKLEDYPFSKVRDCLFNIFTATLHIGGHSSISNLRIHYTVVTGTHLLWHLNHCFHAITKKLLYFYLPNENLTNYVSCTTNNDYHKDGYHFGHWKICWTSSVREFWKPDLDTCKEIQWSVSKQWSCLI